jgi:DNA-binding MarR family transcriptional regulator
MKKEFIDFLNALMEAAPEVVSEKMTDNVKAYLEALTEEKSSKPDLTDNGKLILKYLQSVPVAPYKSKDIAEGLFISSRTVSGGMRKLVTDGFVEKVGKDPVVYTITEKGKNYVIEE